MPGISHTRPSSATRMPRSPRVRKTAFPVCLEIFLPISFACSTEKSSAEFPRKSAASLVFSFSTAPLYKLGWCRASTTNTVSRCRAITSFICSTTNGLLKPVGTCWFRTTRPHREQTGITGMFSISTVTSFSMPEATSRQQPRSTGKTITALQSVARRASLISTTAQIEHSSCSRLISQSRMPPTPA